VLDRSVITHQFGPWARRHPNAARVLYGSSWLVRRGRRLAMRRGGEATDH
jgi:hypothetical protein